MNTFRELAQVIFVCTIFFVCGLIWGGFLVSGQPCNCDPMHEEHAELKPLTEDEFDKLRLQILVDKLREQIDRLKRHDAVGEEQPEPVGELQEAFFLPVANVHRGYPAGAMRHTPAWLKPTRRLLLNSLVHHNAYYIDRANDAETDAGFDYALAQCLYWSLELTSGKER